MYCIYIHIVYLHKLVCTKRAKTILIKSCGTCRWAVALNRQFMTSTAATRQLAAESNLHFVKIDVKNKSNVVRNNKSVMEMMET